MKNLISRIDARLDAWEDKLGKINIRYPSDLMTGILFLLISIVVIMLLPSQVAISAADVVNGREFPKLLMYLMAVCSVALIVVELCKLAMKKPMVMKTMNLLVEVKALIIMAILIATFFIAKYTDMFVLGAVFCAIAFLLFFRCKKSSYYAITLTFVLAIWAAFRFILHVDF